MLRRAFVTATVALALGPAAALAKAPAVERTEAFIDGLLRVKQAPEGGKLAKADKDANQKVFTELDAFFDWDHLTQAPISPRADKFTAAQKAEFSKKFREVIRLVAYPDSGAFFRKAKYTLGEAKEEGEVITVPIQAKKDDLETQVDLHWKKMGTALKMFDVSFDGDSLVQDYRNQFVKIIDKEGAKGLIGRIDKRRAEMEGTTPAKAK